MPSYDSSGLISKFRQRKRLSQVELLEQSGYNISLHRVEHRMQNPKPETLNNIMTALSLQMTDFLFYYFESQPMKVYILRSRLIRALDIGDITQAENLLAEFETLKGFDEGINYQFILCCKALILEQKKAKPEDIMPLIQKGLTLTFPEFKESDFIDVPLILEEPELLHLWARILNKRGKKCDAIKLLNRVRIGLDMLPSDDHEKEKKLASILLTLSEYLIQSEKYEEALNICLIGEGVSFTRRRGKYTPAFLYNKALCMQGLGRTDECRFILQKAYFGYILLGKGEDAKRILTAAKDLFDVHFNTYNVKPIMSQPQPLLSNDDLESLKCENIGELIRFLRKKSKLNLKELCQGICGVSTLSRIEKGEIKGNIYILEALMQRLGRDINLYLNTYLSASDFDERQTRDRATMLLATQKYEEAEKLIKQLEVKESYKAGLGKQFIMMSKATLLRVNEALNAPNPRYETKLYEALTITWTDYSENDINKRHLTYYEIIILNLLANYYSDTGDLFHAVKLHERLRISINNNYIDISEKARTYCTILYNYSKILGLLGHYRESMNVIEEGMNFSSTLEELRILPKYAYNKAHCLFELGETAKSIPYFALAYYGAAMFAGYGFYDVMLPIVRKFAKERLGIIFD